MSSPPRPAPALAPSTPERQTALCTVDPDAESEHQAPSSADVSRELASLTLEEEKDEASPPSTSSSLVTLVSADGFRLTVPRRVAEESGTVRQLLLSRGENDASDVTIPLPAIRKRELASIFDFCARQLRGRDELERIARIEEEQLQAKRTRSSSSSRDGGEGTKAAASAAAASSGPSPAALALALRAALAADAAAWAASAPGGGGSGSGSGSARTSFSSRALLGRTLAANYLDVPAALAACADAVAGALRGRSPAEIRARFGIAPDLSRAEEEAIKADCAWAFDCC